MARVFITGSTDGLGRAAARSLLDHGHQVVLHAAAPPPPPSAAPPPSMGGFAPPDAHDPVIAGAPHRRQRRLQAMPITASAHGCRLCADGKPALVPCGCRPERLHLPSGCAPSRDQPSC
jgi:NAD(P)-dependent dehydrogenase (short-subunit alcohol dehydrogenase family)